MWRTPDPASAAGGALGNIAGPWSIGSPPSSTSGTVFTVDESGLYLIDCAVSAYVTVAGALHIFVVWINGVAVAQKNYFFNTANDHREMGRAVQELRLDAGPNYLWVQTDTAFDANDRCSLTWVRTGL